MIVNSFDVTAKCAAGYKGKASVGVCQDVDEPYSLGGCEPEKCAEPTAREMEGYDLTVFSLERPSFSVSLKCTSGIGHGKAKECTKDGEPYTLEGCYIGECASPAEDVGHGYVVCSVKFKPRPNCLFVFSHNSSFERMQAVGQCYGPVVDYGSSVRGPCLVVFL